MPIQIIPPMYFSILCYNNIEMAKVYTSEIGPSPVPLICRIL